MKKTLFSSLCLLITAVLLYGCKGDQGPAGPAGGTDLPTGTIQGFVNIYNEYGQTKSNALAGTVVTVDGTSLSTTTDSTGNYFFQSVPIGVRTINFTRAGYGSNREPNFGISIGRNSISSELDSLPSYTIARHALSRDTANGTLRDTVRLSSPTPSGRSRRLIVFISDRNDVSSDPARHRFSQTRSVSAGDSVAIVSISRSDLEFFGLRQGSTAHIVAHGISTGENSRYEDARTQRTVYTALTPATPVLQFIVP
jgi:hypothetical protein